MNIDGNAYTSLSLIGSLLVLIGLLTLGALLASILAIYLSAKAIENKIQTKTSFRERIENEEQERNLKGQNKTSEVDEE